MIADQEQATNHGPVGYLPENRQFTRRDLNIDEDRNEDLNMNYDFVNVPPRRHPMGVSALDNLSSSGSASSQSSSTVIRPTANSNRPAETLKNIPLKTLETDRAFTGRIRASLMSSRLNSGNFDTKEEEQQPRVVPAEPEPVKSPTETETKDDKLNDYIDGILPSPPASPPRELDPSKLYALYDFNGPDPSHIELYKDDSIELLNDTDSYWWLVRRLNDGNVGFAPAEILETYEERLARLNCWKNEILERGKDNAHLSREDLKLFEYEPAEAHSSIIHSSGDDITASDSGDIINISDGNQRLNTSLSSFGSHRRARVASSPQLTRKSSLKRSKSSVKKSVTFAGSLPNLPEEGSVANTKPILEETMAPLVVPKRACKTNFLINDLDAYNERFMNFHGPQGPPSPPFTSGSIGSYSPSTNSEYDSEQDNWDTNNNKSDKVQKTMKVRSFSENRAEFLQKKSRLHPQQDTDSDSDSDSHSSEKSNSTSDIPLSQSLRMLDDLIQNSPEFNVSRGLSGESKFLDVDQHELEEARRKEVDVVDALADYEDEGYENEEDTRGRFSRAARKDEENGLKDHSLVSTISSVSSSTMSTHIQQGNKNTVSSVTTADSLVDSPSTMTGTPLTKTPTVETATIAEEGNGSRDTSLEEDNSGHSRHSSSGSTVGGRLHPLTTEIFNPLIDHIEELERLLNDISVSSNNANASF